MPDHPLKKNEILDIFYNGLTDAFRDHLDSCVGCVFRERTVEQAELLLNNILSNDNDWTLPEPTPKKRGIRFLSPEDMQEAKKSMKEKGIKAEDVKNLLPIEEIHGLNLPPVEEIYGFNPSPIEEIHGLDNPTHVVKVNSLYRYDKAEILFTKCASPCLDEFDKFMVKQEDFNAYFGRELKHNAGMLEHLGDYMANVKGERKLISKHASMVPLK